ncbi:hypothetical protein Mapa_013274 [Marchantia paleacea]|nr:hypothetical protein Mapa_013274 [Marchantia paleacea]
MNNQSPQMRALRQDTGSRKRNPSIIQVLITRRPVIKITKCELVHSTQKVSLPHLQVNLSFRGAHGKADHLTQIKVQLLEVGVATQRSESPVIGRGGLFQRFAVAFDFDGHLCERRTAPQPHGRKG